MKNSLSIVVCFFFLGLSPVVLGSQESQCKDDTTTLTGSFLFDFVGNPHQLLVTNNSDVALLGNAVLQSYNSVVPPCSGSRSLSSFELVTNLSGSDFNASAAVEEAFSLEFNVQGFCEDCQDDVLLFDTDDPCGCVGPTVGIFHLDLRERLDALVSNGSLTSSTRLSNGAEIRTQQDCPDTTDAASSSVVVDFVGCPSEELMLQLDELGTLFRDTYNALNSFDTKRCDPLFRQITSVSVSTNADFVVGTSSSSSSVRDLQEEEACSQQFGLRFDLNITCRGCDPSTTTTTVFDRIDKGNQATIIATGHDEQRRRFLQTAAGGDSSCRCPANNPVLRAITEEEMAQAFGAALSRSNFPIESLSVLDLIEIEPFECSGEENTFETFLEVVWMSAAPGQLPQEAIDNLAEQCRISYNNLANNRFCDPKFRRMVSVELFSCAPPEEPSTRRGLQLFLRPFALVYRIVFACPFCPKETALFDDAARRRRLEEEEEALSVGDMKARRRRMQEEEDRRQCYCATDSIDRAATEREFLARYAADFRARDDGGEILSVQEVDPVEKDPHRGADACETNSDCDATMGDLCVASQCLFDGNPRITLTWEGNTDYDLYCTTPENKTLSFENTFDPSSKGVFDTGYVQTANASHVESIYFPKDGSSAGGEYICRVQEFENRGSSDEWTIEVSATGILLLNESGTGSQTDIAFRHEDETAPEDCDLNSQDFTCCQDTDCSRMGAICANFRCIQDGQPRFTLSWYGNDFLRLTVYTPDGITISKLNPVDEPTGGTFEETPKYILEPTFHGQNVYFPESAPAGEYIFFVESIQQNGVSDSWEVTASQPAGAETYTGSGTSAYFTLFYDPPTPSVKPVDMECFSGEMTVLTQDRGIIFMKDLKLGDMVAAATGSNRFEQVYSFGHRNEHQAFAYLLLDPVGLEVSKNHMVFLESGHAVPASALKVGDHLGGEEITSIRNVKRQGAYAPFTESGTILVNDVASSNYVAFQDSGVLIIGDNNMTPFTYQWLAHTFQLPHRMWCRIQDCSQETYTDEGISTWLHTPLVFTKWWLRQNTVLMTVILLPLLCILGVFASVDMILREPYKGILALTVAWIIANRRLMRREQKGRLGY